MVVWQVLVTVALLGGAAVAWSHRALASLRSRAAILEQVHDAVIVWRLDGRIVYWNSAAERLYGWSPAEAAARLRGELLGTGLGSGQDLATADVEARHLGGRHWAGKLFHVTRAGRPVVVQSRLADAGFDHGVAVVVETNQDVTAEDAAERAVLEGAERVRAIVDTAVDAIITIDERGTVESFNAAAPRTAPRRWRPATSSTSPSPSR